MTGGAPPCRSTTFLSIPPNGRRGAAAALGSPRGVPGGAHGTQGSGEIADAHETMEENGDLNMSDFFLGGNIICRDI